MNVGSKNKEFFSGHCIGLHDSDNGGGSQVTSGHLDNFKNQIIFRQFSFLSSLERDQKRLLVVDR